MTPEQTAQLLYRLKAIHHEIPIGEDSLAAWHEAIGDLDFDLAIEASQRLNAHATRAPKPGTVREVCSAILDRGMTSTGEIAATVRADRSEHPAIRASRSASTHLEAL